MHKTSEWDSARERQGARAARAMRCAPSPRFPCLVPLAQPWRFLMNNRSSHKLFANTRDGAMRWRRPTERPQSKIKFTQRERATHKKRASSVAETSHVNRERQERNVQQNRQTRIGFVRLFSLLAADDSPLPIVTDTPKMCALISCACVFRAAPFFNGVVPARPESPWRDRSHSCQRKTQNMRPKTLCLYFFL